MGGWRPGVAELQTGPFFVNAEVACKYLLKTSAGNPFDLNIYCYKFLNHDSASINNVFVDIPDRRYFFGISFLFFETETPVWIFSFKLKTQLLSG